MDTARYEALTVKSDNVGLTDDEADELGRMIAELEGRAYDNAESVQAPKEPTASDPVETPGEACGHLGCGCLTHELFCGEFCRTHAAEPNEAGPEFDCGCGHDACKAVVGEA
jgi:hypothetical protein